MPEFCEFPKIPRLSRECVVTEKIDGTNASIHIEQWTGLCPGDGEEQDGSLCVFLDGEPPAYALRVGSRTRWITPKDDNYGFARWIYDHRVELIRGLGEGHHFGEWWGGGIQRKYGLTDKRFSLFNANRWSLDPQGDKQQKPPQCCYVVPVLYRGMFETNKIRECLESLRLLGSVAAPGFMRPEGVVIYHVAGGLYFKKTIEKDDEPKSMGAPRD